MKLLFDQNLSYRLVARLIDLFPGSSHVRLEDLDTATDAQVRDYAERRDFTIVTKNGSDFDDLMRRFGHPPKILWLDLGNCTTQFVEDQIRANRAEIYALNADPNEAMLIINRKSPKA